MGQWTCPNCGDEIHGIATRLDQQLAKDLHEKWAPCDYTHDV